MNKIIVTGALGRDAELKSLPSGKNVLEFSVAVNSGFGDSKKTYFSKLPVRQLTPRPLLLCRFHVSKLPVRQLTSLYKVKACRNVSKLPVRQLTFR